MLKLDIIFSGLGITKRGDKYISRSLNSFGDLLNNISGLPILLDHPQDIETFDKSLLKTDTNFSIIGNVEEVISITEDSIRVRANIIDPYFEEFYNSLTEEQKNNIDTSPAVESELILNNNVDGYDIYEEKIISLNHIAILLKEFGMLEGYWSKYISDYMVKDIIENDNEKIQQYINNNINGDVSMIGTIENTAHVDNNEELQEAVKEVVEDIVAAEVQPEPEEQVEVFEEKVKEDEIDSEEIKEEEKVEEKIDSEELIEEKKEEEVICDSDEDIKEEVKEDIVSEETKAEANELSEEQVAHIVEEVKEINEIIEQPVEEVKEEVVEEKIDEEEIKEEEVKEEDIIDEEYETVSDQEKEIIVKMVSNLIDSVEGFRKPMFKDRVKASVYLKKALNLNKEFIDSKYHSVIDSIDETSIEFGKDILKSIDRKKNEKIIGKEYVQVAGNTFVKRIF